jgi:hypothetical protein
VLGERWEMHRRPRADNPLLPAEMEDSFSIDDVDALAVKMAVIGCAARREFHHLLDL